VCSTTARPARDPNRAAKDVVAGFVELEVHFDVADGMHTLANAGIRIATLTNGAAAIAETLLERAGLADLVERFLSVDEVRRWKPAREPYLHAARELGVTPEQCALIAVHPGISTARNAPGCRRAG
jgi:2-haloacid dehalogenase